MYAMRKMKRFLKHGRKLLQNDLIISRIIKASTILNFMGEPKMVDLGISVIQMATLKITPSKYGLRSLIKY